MKFLASLFDNNTFRLLLIFFLLDVFTPKMKKIDYFKNMKIEYLRIMLAAALGLIFRPIDSNFGINAIYILVACAGMYGLERFIQKRHIMISKENQIVSELLVVGIFVIIYAVCFMISGC